ncbi:Rid family detoxifying hydrolase [bacterium]|nr:Rid family detoxifying hydrolase [bacterium]
MQIISTEKAPKAIGPYSQGVTIAVNQPVVSLIFVSGQGAIQPEKNEYIPLSVAEETKIALTNIQHILEEAGSDISKVVKTTVFLANLNDFQAMNEVYATFFTQNPPARSTIEASKLPKGFKVEIEAIAFR